MTKEEILNQGLASLFTETTNKPIAFMTFAKQRNLTGKFTDTKDPLYVKTHRQGDLAGTEEAVAGARFECTREDGSKGIILMALSRNAAKVGLAELMKNPSELQVRIDQYNGYEQLTLCTGQSDREAGSVSGTFVI